MVECHLCNVSDVLYSHTSSNHRFDGNFTRSQMRRIDWWLCWFNKYDELLSEQTKFKERFMLLIDHYNLMMSNRTLQCNVH